MADPATFADLGLKPELLETLEKLGYEEPTPIQLGAIPPLLAGRDLVGQAATGTGKTAAFALPMLQGLPAKRRRRAPPSALVLVPTRELAMQVAEAVHRYGKALGVAVLPVYGGQPIQRQLAALDRGVDVVVATPGRALDHLRRGSLSLAKVRYVVLDEADEMLDMGFTEDIEAILAELPEAHQTALFSATVPARIRGIARRHLTDPAEIRIAAEAPAKGALPKVRQTAYVVPRSYKLAALGRLLDLEAPEAAIVFCRTRNEVDQLHEALGGRGYRAEALHGGLSQAQRDQVMRRLKRGAAEIVVATDVAARGLDIERLTHVINYDVPSAPEAYVHRIGRVGRAGREGVALTLAEPREHRLLKSIERLTRRRIEVAKLPTVADLRARRLDLTRAAIREAVLAGDLGPFAVLVESLSDELDPFDVAAAAVKLAHEATRPETEEVEIPEPRPTRKRPEGGPPRGAKPRRGRDRRPGPGMTRVFIGAGRASGIRPQDLVGAIANEAGISGRAIGAIEIGDRHALVEVPEAMAGEVVAALRRSRIKGRKVTVRRDRDVGSRDDGSGKGG